MTIQLRPYQTDCLAAIRQAYREGQRRIAIQLPTGTGKTVIFNEVALGALRKGGRTLVIAHREELLQQAKDKLCRVDPELCESVGFVQAKQDEVGAPIVMASVQTICRPERLARLREAGEFGVVIVDEAHHAAADSYQTVLKGLGCFEDTGMLTLGVSATLSRADNLDLRDTFEGIAYSRDMLGMIREGYLVDLRGVQVKLEEFRPEDIRVRAGDYVAQDAADALSAAEAPKHIVGAWREHAVDEEHPEGRKTLVFAPTLALCDEIAEAFQAAGVSAANVSHLVSDRVERRNAIEDFASGKLRVAVNAMLWTEGFDEPSVECVVVARPTKSQPLYVQMVGRGTRLHPGKRDCLVMDMVGATDRMDLTVLATLAGQNTRLNAKAEKVLEEEGVAALADWLEMERIREGKIVAKRVNLFRRADLAWVHASDSLWALSAGSETVMLQEEADARWMVVVAPRWGDSRILAHGLDQGYAMGVAEEYVRTATDENGRGVMALVSKEREWRGNPPSERMREALRKWRVAQWDDPNLTAGEASDLMTAKIASAKARDLAR